LSRLFISHSSKNDDWAIAVKDWLVREGWSSQDEIFLDLDPERGIVAGQRWARALEDAATRCEAVLFVVSEEWLSSKWCGDEYQLATRLNKKLFALLIDDVALDRLPGGLTAQWQVVRLKGDPAERFLTVHPRTGHQSPVHIGEAALKSLKRGLEKAGIGTETFELQPDADGPFGWRTPYRGLEALEPADAAVFFGRSADIVRGIDALRGLAAHRPPWMLVLLGASGTGKSSFLRAGLWPRLNRDDSQWLPLRTIRAGRDGAIEGHEGLLAALEDVHRRFGRHANRADLRQRLAAPDTFVRLLRELREAAARRAHAMSPPYPLPVICLDQGEELFAAGAKPESEKLLQLAHGAIVSGEALLLVTIRSDAFGSMQSAKAFAGVVPVPLSLGPVPSGEVAHVIRGPSEVLRRNAGPQAPVFDAAVVERLQAEIAGEADALPLLAFVLQRLTREHEGTATIGLAELERTGGVAAAIEAAAEAALVDAGIAPRRALQREALRRLFIPHLARIDRESKAPQRRVAPESELPSDLAALARALTERRLLVVKRVTRPDSATDIAESTLEVAHEALLRQWPMLAELLAEDRDALLLLDGVLSAAVDWDKTDTANKADFLVHHGSRLMDAQGLASRGPDWSTAIAPGHAYLAACAKHEAAEREEREIAFVQGARMRRRVRITLAIASCSIVAGVALYLWQSFGELARREEASTRFNTELGRRAQANEKLQAFLDSRQQQLDQARADLTAEQAESKLRKMELERRQVDLVLGVATGAQLRGNVDSALRLTVHALKLGSRLDPNAILPLARVQLAAASWKAKWRQLLVGRNGDISSAEFRRDGSCIVMEMGSSGHTVHFWNAMTMKEVALLRGLDGVPSADLSPDGSRIVTGGIDKTARIWDVATGQQIAVLSGHSDPVTSVAFSADGSRIVTASNDMTARIWDATTTKELVTLRGHEGAVIMAAFSPDGARIVTASLDRTARIWNVKTKKEVAVLRGHEYPIVSAAFSPNGLGIVTASLDKTARIWDALSGREIITLRGHQAGLASAAFSPDGSRIVTASGDRTARIWDAATGAGIVTLFGHEAPVVAAGFSSDGTRVVTASEDKTARIWDAAASGQATVLRGHGDYVVSATYSPDGSLIATASSDKTARIFDTATARETRVLRGHGNIVTSAVFSPDGRRIVTTSSDKTARVWDVATAKMIVTLQGHEDAVLSAAFSPDGTRLVTGGIDKTARIWDAASGQQVGMPRRYNDAVTSVTFSPDSSQIVAGLNDSTAHIWDAKSAKEIAVLRGHEAAIFSVAFSPDSAHVATASADTTTRIWDVAAAKEIAVLQGHDDWVRSVAFSSDGTHIVTGSEDTTARIWDAATAKEIAVLRGHEGTVRSAAFSYDNSRIVTASYDKTARIWDVDFATMPLADLVNEVCQRQLRGLTTLTRDEMRLIGHSESAPAMDVCSSND
jgi:WD40 repeat protein